MADIEIIDYTKSDEEKVIILNKEQQFKKDQFTRFSKRYWILFIIICLFFLVLSISLIQVVHYNELMKTPRGRVIKFVEALDENDYDLLSTLFYDVDSTERLEIATFWNNFVDEEKDKGIDYFCGDKASIAYYNAMENSTIDTNPNVYRITYNYYRNKSYTTTFDIDVDIKETIPINENYQLVKCTLIFRYTARLEDKNPNWIWRANNETEVYLVKDQDHWDIYSNLHSDGEDYERTWKTDVPTF